VDDLELSLNAVLVRWLIVTTGNFLVICRSLLRGAVNRWGSAMMIVKPTSRSYRSSPAEPLSLPKAR